MAKQKAASATKREKDIPEYKLKLVADLVKEIKKSHTVLIASTKGLPSSQFHEIKKNLRGKADIRVAKRSLVLRAIELSARDGIRELENVIVSDFALFFSDIDAFELSGLLAENQSATRARAGDIAPEDINVEPGPTDLPPGPAISELSGVGLKVAVEGGKLAIKLPATIAHAGDTIKENVASVMGKLGITPMKVGFEPVAAYDAHSKKVYVGIKIDKKKTLEELRTSITKALSFAVNRGFPTKETLTYLLAKAGNEEKAIQSLVDKTQTTTKEGQ